MRRLSGVGASPGVAVGPALVIRQEADEVRFRVTPGAVREELRRLDRAVAEARHQLEAIKAHLAAKVGREHAYLCDVQLLILEDPLFLPQARALVETERLNAEWAIDQVLEGVMAALREAADPYLRERHGDLAELAARLKANLRGERATPLDRLANEREGVVLVTDTLTLALLAGLDRQRVLGLVAETGGRTSHAAIVARSLGVPAVVGVTDACRAIAPGALVVLDGATGQLVIDPPETLVREARARRTVAVTAEAPAVEPRPIVTVDGVPIRLEANIERPEDVSRARACGAEGIGLFRSEFLAAGGEPALLTEEGQYRLYAGMLEAMHPDPVTVRTFSLHRRRRRGPARRLADEDPRALLVTQLRALLRAADHGTLRIMFPFVSGIEVLADYLGALDEAALSKEARPRVLVGAMIEIPSAILMLDELAPRVDFLSVGTNDLIQYALAIDRADSTAACLVEPAAPAVLRLLARAARTARRHRRHLAVCGEMAADARLLPVLVGLGFREFSMAPAAIPLARRTLVGLDAAAARQLARRVLRAATAAEVEAELTRWEATRPVGSLATSGAE